MTIPLSLSSFAWLCENYIIAVQIAFVSTTSEGYPQTRKWVNYHRVIGVTHFYLFVDGQAARPEVLVLLSHLSALIP